MTTPLPLSSRLYSRLLVLYPEDLRRDYGTDMALVFADDLAAARREAGIRGALRVWRCALAEFLRFALPGHASRPAVRVPAICFALTILSFAAEILVAATADRVAVPRPFHTLCALLPVATFLAPPISLLSVLVCRGRDTISLGLSNLHREER